MQIVRTLCVFMAVFSSAQLASADTDSSPLSRIDNYLAKGVEQEGFSGALLIAERNEIALHQSYGMADRDQQRPITADSVFDIGSVTKQFTAAAILLLVEQKQLTLSDTLAQHFKGVPKDKRHITLHQLLTHSAGITDSVGDGDFDHMPTDVFFKQVLASPLAFEPGTGFRYSNTGYSLLARIIELQSEQEYEQFVREHLFKPAGMNHTGYLLANWSQDQRVSGYQLGEFSVGAMTERYQRDGKISWVLKGNGGINATMTDMFLWYRALRNHTVLTPHSIDLLTRPHVKENPEGRSHYAYGWAIFKSPRDTKIVAHNGSNGIFYFDFIWLKDEDKAIIYATNALTPNVQEVGLTAERMLFDDAFTPDPLTLHLTTELLRVAQAHTGSPDALEQKIVTAYAARIDHPAYLNRAGLALVRNGQIQQALPLLRANLAIFPTDGNLWDSLGEAYFTNAQYSQAKESFEKALAFKDPDRCYWCSNSEQMLKRIEKKSNPL
ncbi:serine hydrolase domain-containing protein [Simiduia aestuariiviva]|uniref:CubicO group peptidase (Beta-lactamase class C family) n=1 Tax=Simiduia aestuariiviva TaxID=1510459 RepID=A0A839UNV9_9GAMM|nr:serine hydrolase domain-containing protein [Simiduia aestuariiviva]MBB3169522.1 CubicO group peptidase (beta-lactamase class C family) [Simiduia aestuariiviva]